MDCAAFHLLTYLAISEELAEGPLMCLVL